MTYFKIPSYVENSNMYSITLKYTKICKIKSC